MQKFKVDSKLRVKKFKDGEQGVNATFTVQEIAPNGFPRQGTIWVINPIDTPEGEFSASELVVKKVCDPKDKAVFHYELRTA